MDFSFDSPAGANNNISEPDSAPVPPQPSPPAVVFSRAQTIAQSIQLDNPSLTIASRNDDDIKRKISAECSELAAECNKLLGDDQQGPLADFLVTELLRMRHLVTSASCKLTAGMSETECVAQLSSHLYSGASAPAGAKPPAKSKRKRTANSDDINQDTNQDTNQDDIVYGGSINEVSAELLRDADITKNMTDRILQLRSERPFISIKDFKTRVKGFGDLKLSKLYSKGIYIVAPKPPVLLPNES